MFEWDFSSEDIYREISDKISTHLSDLRNERHAKEYTSEAGDGVSPLSTSGAVYRTSSASA